MVKHYKHWLPLSILVAIITAYCLIERIFSPSNEVNIPGFTVVPHPQEIGFKDLPMDFAIDSNTAFVIAVGLDEGDAVTYQILNSAINKFR